MTRLEAFRALLALDESPKSGLVWIYKLADRTKTAITRRAQ